MSSYPFFDGFVKWPAAAVAVALTALGVTNATATSVATIPQLIHLVDNKFAWYAVYFYDPYTDLLSSNVGWTIDMGYLSIDGRQPVLVYQTMTVSPTRSVTAGAIQTLLLPCAPTVPGTDSEGHSPTLDISSDFYCLNYNTTFNPNSGSSPLEDGGIAFIGSYFSPGGTGDGSALPLSESISLNNSQTYDNGYWTGGSMLPFRVQPAILSVHWDDSFGEYVLDAGVGLEGLTVTVPGSGNVEWYLPYLSIGANAAQAVAASSQLFVAYGLQGNATNFTGTDPPNYNAYISGIVALERSAPSAGFTLLDVLTLSTATYGNDVTSDVYGISDILPLGPGIVAIQTVDQNSGPYTQSVISWTSSTLSQGTVVDESGSTQSMGEFQLMTIRKLAADSATYCLVVTGGGYNNPLTDSQSTGWKIGVINPSTGTLVFLPVDSSSYGDFYDGQGAWLPTTTVDLTTSVGLEDYESFASNLVLWQFMAVANEAENTVWGFSRWGLATSTTPTCPDIYGEKGDGTSPLWGEYGSVALNPSPGNLATDIANGYASSIVTPYAQFAAVSDDFASPGIPSPPTPFIFDANIDTHSMVLNADRGNSCSNGVGTVMFGFYLNLEDASSSELVTIAPYTQNADYYFWAGKIGYFGGTQWYVGGLGL